MPAEPPSGLPSPPDWEILIAHHFPNRYSRTIALRIRRRSYHFCARCSGELVGFLGLIVPFLALPSVGATFSSPFGGIVLGVFPSVPLVDWLSQTLGRRESTNGLRVASGILLGAAFGGLVGYGVTARWAYFGLGLGVLAGYLAIAAAVLYRTGVWQKVLAEHFP